MRTTDAPSENGVALFTPKRRLEAARIAIVGILTLGPDVLVFLNSVKLLGVKLEGTT